MRLWQHCKQLGKPQLWELGSICRISALISSSQCLELYFWTIFIPFLPLQPRWILTLAPPAAAPHPQTWWWMTQQGASSPTRCSRRTAKKTEWTARPASGAAGAVRPRPGLSSARKKCRTWGSKSTVGRGKGCTIWTRRWTAWERSCPTLTAPRSASCQRSPPCC